MDKKGYIYPGTSGMVLGSAWPVTLMILAAIGGFFGKWFYKPVKNRVLKFRKK